MSLPTFQRLLSRLVMSPALRARLAAEGEAALASDDLRDFDRDLDPRERRRLVAVARDERTRAGTLIHRSFRLSMLARTLPRTCRLLATLEGEQSLEEVVHAYWEEHPPRNYLYAREAGRFAAYLRRRLEAGTLASPYLEEVLAAELAIVELGGAEPWEPPPAAVAAGPTDAPRLHPLCRLVPFRHHPDAVLGALEEERPPGELPGGEHYLLLISSAPGQVSLKPLPADRGRALLCPAEAEAEAVAEMARAGYLVPASFLP